MSDYDYIDAKNKDGTILGQSTSKLVSFYGIQPVDQPASLTAAVSTITYVTASTVQLTCNCTIVSTISSFAISTSSGAGGLVGAVKNVQIRIGELEDVLQEVGIIIGGTAITTTTALPFDFIGAGGGGEGMILGCSATTKIGFWGVTPCDQPTAITTCTATAYATLITTVTLASATAVDATISLMVSGNTGYGIGTAGTSNELASLFSKVASLQIRLSSLETNLTEVGILPGATAVTSANSLGYDYLDGGADSGTIFGRDSSALIGFWAATPCDQAAALTTAQATISYVAAVANTYVMAIVSMQSIGFGFVSVTAGNTLIYAVQNAQVRLLEIETALNAVGLQAT